MKTRKLRVYADTSVFGGCFDDEFAVHSKAFFEEVRAGRFMLLISRRTIQELDAAPERVQNVLANLPLEQIERVADSAECGELQDAYLEAGVVGPRSKADAEHVAAASIAGADLIVSWNFKHIVHFEKINGYHGVNLLRGYKPVGIYSPREVIEP